MTPAMKPSLHQVPSPNALRSRSFLNLRPAASVRRKSALAEVIADALRTAEDTNVAFMASSSFEDITIRKGVTSTDEVMKVVTFLDDKISVVKLTGDQIRRALEHAVGLYPQRSPYFLQVSGLTVTVNGPPRKPSGRNQ